jgi:hypothetical protein
VPALGPAWTWAAAVGGLWALLGALRGGLQPARWPVSYALVRWLGRLLVWAAALCLLAAAAHEGWRWAGPALVPGVAPAGSGGVLLLAAALAIVPATLGEAGAGHRARNSHGGLGGRSALRPLLLAAAGVALVLLVVAGAFLVGPTMERLEAGGQIDAAQAWVMARWTWLETRVAEAMDQLLIRYHDRRAPLAPVPGPTPSPAAGGAGP